MLSEMLNVKHLLNIQLRRLSLGERMKMELINSFLYSPEVVFLDEPTIGLDLNSQLAIRKFVRDYREERKTTIIITSHYMDDIEETCDRVILLSKGNKIFDGTMNEISGLYSSNKVLQLVFDQTINPNEFEKYGEIIEVKDNSLKLIIKKEQYRDIVAELINQNRNLVDISLTNIPFKNIINQVMARDGDVNAEIPV